MKNGKLFVTALCIMLISLVGCSRNADNLTTTEDVLIRSPWAIDYYFQTQDMTSQYGNSKLLFSSTGSVGFEQNGQLVSGTWQQSKDASGNDVISINFPSNDVNAKRLNDTWIITNRSTGVFQFEDGNTGGSSALLRIKAQ